MPEKTFLKKRVKKLNARASPRPKLTEKGSPSKRLLKFAGGSFKTLKES